MNQRETSTTMELDPHPQAPPSSPPKGGDPKPPQQLYPPPEAEGDLTATNTQVRIMREEVLEDLQEESQFILPMRTRLALVGLLAASLCVVIILVPRGRQPAPQPQAPVVTAPETLPEAPPAATATPKPIPTPDAAKPGKPFSKDLADIEVLAALIRDDVTLEPAKAVQLLAPYNSSADPAVKKAAQEALAPVFVHIDEQGRTLARAGAEAAEDYCAQQNFPAALDALKAALEALPPGAPWSERGKKTIGGLIDRTTRQREDVRLTALNGLEDALRGGGDDAKARLAALLSHPDSSFREPAEAIRAKLAEENAKKLADKQQRDSAARTGWLDFFQKFDAHVAKGEYPAAMALCTRPAGDPMLNGGVANPQAVLDGCAADLKAIAALYEAALNKAKDARGDVILETRRHTKLEGKLEGVEGRQIKLMLGGAHGGANVDELSAAGLAALIGGDELARLNLRPALWALGAYEAQQTAMADMARLYGAAKLELPAHWAERFRLTQMRKLEEELDRKLADINQALTNENQEGVKTALEAARPAIAEYEKLEPLNEARRKTVVTAAKLVGNMVAQEIVLQNDSLPTADYAGIQIDQISEYRDDLDKPNLPTQFGLIAGSAGPNKRALFAVSGIESAIGKSKLKRATLQLYQIESPNFTNAAIALIRLKRQWVPGSGTWLSYDKTKKLKWAVPGALGDADIESKEEARVIIDKKRDLWRSWDITAYVKDVLAGKQQNFGFLLRVMNGEPDYQVRFYPATDLDSKKDKSLRPRVVIEVEKEREK